MTMTEIMHACPSTLDYFMKASTMIKHKEKDRQREDNHACIIHQI